MLEICPPNEISVNVIYRNKYLGWPFIGIFSAIDWQNYDRIIALCIFLTEDANETRSISERILLLGYKRKKKKILKFKKRSSRSFSPIRSHGATKKEDRRP